MPNFSSELWYNTYHAKSRKPFGEDRKEESQLSPEEIKARAYYDEIAHDFASCKLDPKEYHEIIQGVVNVKMRNDRKGPAQR